MADSEMKCSVACEVEGCDRPATWLDWEHEHIEGRPAYVCGRCAGSDAEPLAALAAEVE